MAPMDQVRKIVREPLLHFLLVGLVLFAAAQHYRQAHDRYRIELTSDRIAALKQAYATEFNHQPSRETMARLIDDFIASEVLYREGIARGLAKDDEIVRRRVIQKASFLETDLEPPATPSEAQLRAWFDKHRQRYATAPTVDFHHVFFAIVPGEEDAARRRAARVLATLPATQESAAGRGDNFPDLYAFSGFNSDEARRLFGDSEIASALFHAPVGEWAGPYRSSFGWHLVRVTRSRAGRDLPFASVRKRVLAEYMTEAGARAKEERLAQLRSRYTVVRPD